MNASLPRCVALALAGAACACSPTEYAGDGTFEHPERPSFLCGDRYFLHLGALDLSRSTTTYYRLAGLPETEFTLGIVIAQPQGSGNSVPMGVVDSRVRIQLRDERDRVVVMADGSLSGWTWSTDIKRPTNAFVYRRGEAHQRDLGGGTTMSDRIGVNADSGWGTSFTARSEGRYRLEVAVERGDAAVAQYDVSLRADGGYGCEL